MGRIDRELPEIDYWRFTAMACKTLFLELFAADRLSIRIYGNVLAGTAFWNGMAAEELSSDELDFRDDRFPVIIAIRAVKT
jgi:hypothetical protein